MSGIRRGRPGPCVPVNMEQVVHAAHCERPGPCVPDSESRAVRSAWLVERTVCNVCNSALRPLTAVNMVKRYGRGALRAGCTVSHYGMVGRYEKRYALPAV
jgi:hypothetical protein